MVVLYFRGRRSFHLYILLDLETEPPAASEDSAAWVRSDLQLGYVGPPLANSMIKLVDVPDMNYFAGREDVPRGPGSGSGAVQHTLGKPFNASRRYVRYLPHCHNLEYG